MSQDARHYRRMVRIYGPGDAILSEIPIAPQKDCKDGRCGGCTRCERARAKNAGFTSRVFEVQDTPGIICPDCHIVHLGEETVQLFRDGESEPSEGGDGYEFDDAGRRICQNCMETEVLECVVQVLVPVEE